MYRIPKIVMTMLGATGCGKTTYLYGMYATLSPGVNGYFLHTTDPDADVDLTEPWVELCETGALPKPNDPKPKSYQFAFKHEMKTLLEIDCQDFRGGAGTERSKADDDDVMLLRKRLAVSDSIILTLAGEHVARWIADGAPAGLNRARDPMKIARFSRAISEVMETRFRGGQPAPGVVVLITKADRLGPLTGKSTPEALDVVLRNLFNLVPVLASEGVTVLLCPVQIGAFGESEAEQVRPDQVNPKNLHKPVNFALMHYLTEIIPRRHGHLAGIDRQIDEESRQVAAMRGAFLGSWLFGERIRKTEESMEERRSARGEVQDEIAQARSWAEQMAEELRSSPIYRSGKLLQEG
jgi:hypothetical protein